MTESLNLFEALMKTDAHFSDLGEDASEKTVVSESDHFGSDGFNGTLLEFTEMVVSLGWSDENRSEPGSYTIEFTQAGDVVLRDKARNVVLTVFDN